MIDVGRAIPSTKNLKKVENVRPSRRARRERDAARKKQASERMNPVVSISGMA